MTEQTTTKRFPGAFELFSPSVSAIGKNVGTFIGLLGASIGIIFLSAVLAGLIIVVTMAAGGTERPLFVVSLVTAMVLFVSTASVAILPFFTYLQLRSSLGHFVGFGAMLRETMPYFWRLLGLRMLLGLIYFVGILLFVVPFFFLWKRYMLSRYYVVDQNMGVFDAMKASADDSQTYADAVWGVAGVRTLWWVVTQIFGFVGSIVDFLYSCAPSLRYLQMQQAKSDTQNK